MTYSTNLFSRIKDYFSISKEANVSKLRLNYFSLDEICGIPMEQVKKMPFSESQKLIEKEIGHKLGFGYEPGIPDSGNVLIDAHRMIDVDEVEKDLRDFLRL